MACRSSAAASCSSPGVCSSRVRGKSSLRSESNPDEPDARSPRLQTASAAAATDQERHPLARALREAHLGTAPEQPKTEPDDGVGDAPGARDNVDAELHRACVEALPDLVVHMAHLEVALERGIAPAPDAHIPAFHD